MKVNETILVLGDSGDRAAAPAESLESLLEKARNVRIDKQSLRLLSGAPKIVQRLAMNQIREGGEVVIEVRQPSRTDPLLYIDGRFIAFWCDTP